MVHLSFLLKVKNSDLVVILVEGIWEVWRKLKEEEELDFSQREGLMCPGLRE
jgi:hypothetical protein